MENIKAIFHYDTTSRKCIDGDWPSMILNFPHNKTFRLRPSYFAYETRGNIGKLFVEIYTRLAVAASIDLDRPIDAKQLWEQTDTLMTDSVSKNIGIVHEIAQALGSEHKPKHVLCKSHVDQILMF